MAERRTLIRTFLWVSVWLTAACGGGGGGDSEPRTTAFQVTDVTPREATDDVALRAEINIFFSREVDIGTLSTRSVQIVTATGDPILGLRRLASFDPGTVRFLPEEDYEPATTHRIIVTPELRDTSGNPLDQTYEFSFRTESAAPALPGPQDITDHGALLRVGRWFHRITAMPNQRFLVTGGYVNDNAVTNTGENLIVPLVQSTIIGARMIQGRAGHVQVRLLDDRVLIAGGEASSNPFQPLSSCEIFDPDTFTFSPAASMARTRSFATGTLLADGRVLVTGGQTTVGTQIAFHDTAEIYDPATDTWTDATNRMTDARAGHVAGRLPNGDVLVVGGLSSTPSAGRFSPATDGFLASVQPPLASHFFGAGTVLPNGNVFIAGGAGSLSLTTFDPALGFLNGLNSLPSERVFASATAFANGTVLIVGGTDFTKTPALLHSTMDLFVPENGTGRVFRVPTPLPGSTSHHAAALGSDGAVWITGGLPTDTANGGLRQVTVVRPASGN